ncbi:hypothetical protein AB0G15_15210 [Streptosporangium sp. NPDC023825]|uniref:hypothetical protein n=1 Tax=Streptosporangium sp. NPDC023825 TaxID=3154909 RepID=UPI003417DD92
MGALRALREQWFTERSGRWNDWNDWKEHCLVFPPRRGTPMGPDNLGRGGEPSERPPSP